MYYVPRDDNRPKPPPIEPEALGRSYGTDLPPSLGLPERRQRQLACLERSSRILGWVIAAIVLILVCLGFILPDRSDPPRAPPTHVTD